MANVRTGAPRPGYDIRVTGDHSPAIARLLSRVRDDADVLAVILFGSQARGAATAQSDIDVALVLAGADATDGARIQLAYLGESDLDITIFQRAPLHVRQRILEEGRVLFARDEDALYAVAIRTVRAWEDFKHIHRMYLDEVARG